MKKINNLIENNAKMRLRLICLSQSVTMEICVTHNVRSPALCVFIYIKPTHTIKSHTHSSEFFNDLNGRLTRKMSSSNTTGGGTHNNITPFNFLSNAPASSSYAGSGGGNLRLKYCCDLDKDVLSSNFEKRGWTNVNQDEDWNFYWASVITVKAMFNSLESHYRLNDFQSVCIQNAVCT